MKPKTAFQILKKKLNIPKGITVDDADGARMNNVCIGEILEAIEEYVEQEKGKVLRKILVKLDERYK